LASPLSQCPYVLFGNIDDDLVCLIDVCCLIFYSNNLNKYCMPNKYEETLIGRINYLYLASPKMLSPTPSPK
jgi:hypothetical protein